MEAGGKGAVVSDSNGSADARGRVLAIPGYLRWELVYEGRRNAIYRAFGGDGVQAIVKTPAADPLGAYEAARLQYEYAALSAIDVEGVVKPLALRHLGRRPVLVLEDAGPRNLLQYLDGKPLTLAQAVAAAIALTQTVAAVHEHGFVHRDICPENIVCDETGVRLTLVDFDRAMPIAHADTAGMPGEQFTGTLPYSSPEQSGSSGRAVDYRTDYYSLGATFYEILTGSPPFAASDEAEYAHGQLIGRAVPPHERNAQMPALFSDIVLRLLARLPDERYQSAEAIVSDLRSITFSAAPTSDETL
jgi:serine/threonine protein kinase